MAPQTPAAIERRGWLRRVLSLAARVGVAALVGLAVLAGLVAYQAATIVRAGAVAVAESFGARIGREVTVGRAHVELGSILTVRIDDVRIGAAPEQTGDAARPLFELAAIEVKVTAWSILRSFGKHVDVRGIEARAPVLRLVRGASGDLSYGDVVRQLEASAPAADQSDRARAVGVHITGGRVELHDLSRDADHGGVHLAIDAIDVAIPEISGQAPLDVTLDAAVLAPERNVHVEVALSPRGASPGVLLGRLRRLVVQLSPLLVDPLVPFVPEHARLGIAGGSVEGDLGVHVDDAGVVSVNASAGARGLRLVRDVDGRSEPLAKPIDLHVAGDATVDPAGPALTVRALSLSIEGMTFEARADVRGPIDAPEVRALDVSTRDVTFERLLALVQPSALPKSLSKNVSLRGPIALHASAHGPPREAAIDVAVDLGGAAITHPLFEKPAGVPLAAELVGHVGDGLAIESLGLRVGPLALSLHGHVRGEDDVDLAFDTGSVALGGLLRLFPRLGRSLVASGALGGDVQASGHVKRSSVATDAEAHVALRHADVETAALTLQGAAAIGATVHTTDAAKSKLAFAVDVDASGLRASLPGRVDKAAGAPFVMHARGTREGGVTRVEDARLSLDGATIAGHGQRDETTGALHVELPTCELDLAELAHAVPALSLVPPPLTGARLHASATFDDRDAAPASAHLHLADVDVSAPVGHVTGTLDVHGLSPLHEIDPSPSFALHARAEHIDLGVIASARGAPSVDTQVTGKLDADVSLEGAGASWAAIAPTLNGTLKLDASALHVHGARTLHALVVNPLLGKLAEKAKEKHAPRDLDTHVAKASVALRIQSGAFAITSPLTLVTDDGTITMDGTVGFDRSLALRGSVAIPPAAIERATKGFLLPYRDVTLRLRVDGTTEAPRVELLDLEQTLRDFEGSWRHAIGKKLFGRE